MDVELLLEKFNAALVVTIFIEDLFDRSSSVLRFSRLVVVVHPREGF